jgi:hypothetical protein
MTQINRRHFLQFTGGTFASIGLSQLGRFSQADRTLAQPTGRKLALLVGVNNYDDPKIGELLGCLTDVEMQYNLLRYRYGFAEKDILRLITDGDNTHPQPTRQNILKAFEEHLINQAKPGDVVVFHYSGHGGLMQDPDPIDPKSPTNGTLIPSDCRIDARNDIMGRTLFLLTRQIQTDAFTMVLDSCHSGGGTRGNAVIRALSAGGSDKSIAIPSTEELAYQQTQQKKLNLSTEQFKALRSQGIAKGVAIGSAQKEQLAVDGSFDDGKFHAGALTYLLTRYLWQNPTAEPLNDSFDRLSLITYELAAASQNIQRPLKDIAPGQPLGEKPAYQLIADRPNAEAVITKVESDGKTKDSITFWLGGISSRSLNGFEAGSRFSLIDDQGKTIGEIEQTRRSGLEGYGRLTSGQKPAVGALLREKLRNVPTDLSLKIGLDENLGSDQKVILQELQKISRLQVVPLNQQDSVDFILGRMDDNRRQAGATRGVNISEPDGSIGLLSSGNIPITKSFGRRNELASTTVARLRPTLKMLLARKFLDCTINGESAQLNVDIDLISQQSGNVQILSRSTSRALGNQTAPKSHKADSVVNIMITNQEANPIYLTALSIGDDGIISVLYPSEWDSPESAAVIESRKTKQVPIQVYGPAGFFEVLVITSAAPLRDTLRGLQTIARGRGLKQGLLTFDANSRSANEPEDSVVQTTRNLVGDITTRAGAKPKVNDSNAFRVLDPQKTGVFSAILEVID